MVRYRNDLAAVRAFNRRSHTGFIGNEMLAAGPAFEENVGHADLNTRLFLWFPDGNKKISVIPEAKGSTLDN